MDLHLLASLLTFSFVMLIITGIFSLKKAKKEEVNIRLKKYTKNSGQVASRADYTEEAHAQKEPALRRSFKSLSRAMAPKGWIKKAELELAQADIPLRPEEYVTLQIILILGLSMGTFYLNNNILLAAMTALLAAIIPSLLVKRARAKRISTFNNQLGEGLTIMANSLRAGFSFLQAVDTLSKEMPPPLSTEFARLLKEMNLGTTTEDALNNLLQRVDSEDLDLVITAVKIQRQVGGNLAEILEKIGATIQQRIKLKGDLKTLTAQGRISGIIISLLPVFIIIAVTLINPSYMITLLSHPLGFVLLAWAFCSEIIGFLLIRKIVSIEF